MKKVYLHIALALSPFYLSAQNSPINNFKTCTIVSLPIPQNYDGQIKYIGTDDLVTYKKVNDVRHDNSILASFPNIVSSVTVYEVQEDGSLSFMGNSLSRKNSVYEVIYDFSQSQTILVNDTSFILVGAGVRMVAKVKTRESGINLANIEGLGMAAGRKKVTGSLEVRSSSISSPKIQIPATTDLSPSSISNSLQTVATIKSYLSDKDTKITPEILAVGEGISNHNTGDANVKANHLQKVINDKARLSFNQ
jgi:hypothetical protein